jgi:hypothetical protein
VRYKKRWVEIKGESNGFEMEFIALIHLINSLPNVFRAKQLMSQGMHYRQHISTFNIFDKQTTINRF